MHQCDMESCQLATTIIASAELANGGSDATTGAPDSNVSTAGTFKSVEDTKALSIDRDDPGKTVRIATTLSQE